MIRPSCPVRRWWQKGHSVHLNAETLNEKLPFRLEAIALRLEAIAINLLKKGLLFYWFNPGSFPS